jgi:hypothetical protein
MPTTPSPRIQEIGQKCCVSMEWRHASHTEDGVNLVGMSDFSPD